MDYEAFDHLASGISSIATAVGLLIAAAWAYRRFSRQREDYPHVQFTVEVKFIRKQGEWWIVELISHLENKGKVQHRIADFKFDVAGLRDSDPVDVSEKYGGQTFFPHLFVAGRWLPPSFGYTFIDPGVKTHYSFVARIPSDATVLLMHSWFDYPDRKHFHAAETTVSVPNEAAGPQLASSGTG
jgi:hypothetical protein